ncbi:hypothetical protein FC831_10550 [Clostridium botulinum]|nr:hypothetical protein [Clostridium botulinum]
MNIEDKIKNKEVNIIKLEDYDIEYIYDEQSNEYYSSVDNLMDYYEYKPEEIPKYVYGCYFQHFQLDLEWLLESSVDDFDENLLDRIDGVEELSDAIDKFNKTNKDEGSYYIDYKTVVEL